ERSAASRFVSAGLAQRDINPAGEQVLGVPFALTVAEQYETIRRSVHAQQRSEQSDAGRMLPGDQEDDPTSHRNRVIADSLVVAAEQRHVDGGFDPLVPMLAQQGPEHGTSQPVHGVVGGLEFKSSFDVT